MQDKFFRRLNKVQNISKQLLKPTLLNFGQEIQQKVLNMLRIGKNIDIIDNIREKGVLVSKADRFLYAFIIENDSELFEVDVELHVLEERLTHFVYE